jgi:DNA-binding NarL/FixJ family response regulator
MTELRKPPLDLQIVVVSSVNSATLVRKILHQKVDGFLSKMDNIDEIKECVASLYGKYPYVSPCIRELLVDNDHEDINMKLTIREIEILSLLSVGKSTSEVADELNISVHTVMTHRKRVMVKCGANNISHAIVYAIKTGLIDPS